MRTIHFRITILLAALLMLPLMASGQEGVPLEGAPLLWGNKNQISNIGFDFSGATISKGRNFFNSLSKPTQSQSWDIMTDKVWASASLYDRHGRPALLTLGAPIGHQFGYSGNFMLNEANNSYTYADFDLSTATIDDPDQVGSNALLRTYYSINNSDSPYQDITDYPFSRKVFSKLNPGNVLRVIGGNKIGGEWKQGYSFTMPAGTELSASVAFGSGYDSHGNVTKQVVRDVNGVDTVVFSDTDGNTIAAARSGNEQGTPQTYATTLEIGELGYIDIHLPKGAGVFSVLNPSATASGPLKIYDLITETQLSPITTASASRSVPSGFYRIAVSDTYGYGSSDSGPITVTHQVNYYDYSLNYFDRAQRLVSSKQPLNHLESTFSYNSLGQLLETTSPDEGTAMFLYRSDGQIRFSQNSEQALISEVSYTNYDNLGRPVESGAFRYGNAFGTLSAYVDVAVLGSWAGNFSDNHYTVYDMPGSGLEEKLKNCGLPARDYAQTFVAGNVSKTSTGNPWTTTTWYSYDVFGRVRWIVQDIPGLSCLKTIDYVYDPVNGQVLEVDYQRHSRSERFVHHYRYDDAGRLGQVRTSTDGAAQELQATYRYNESGSLRRTELAGNLQGIDYVYNLNGQLKAINHPSLSVGNDPGGDGGGNGFLTDVFGLAIDYHNGDYQRPGTLTPIARQTNTGNEQYNGNIKALHSSTQGFSSRDEFNTYMYGYDKNNWLSTANFGASDQVSIGGGQYQNNFTADSNQDYSVSNLSYDANGNIQGLKRNGVTNGSGTNDMDDFTYHYDGSNKLQHVGDTGDNIDPDRYDDLRDQTNNGLPNYTYNDIGQLTVDVEGRMLYEYNSSGLVKRIHTFSNTVGAGNGQFTLYEQDYGNVTDTELLYWSEDSGTASINYSGVYDIKKLDCPSLSVQYGRSLHLRLNGNRRARRDFNVIPGVGHELDLDVIAFENDATGFKITIYDKGGTLPIATSSYNTALAPINDPDHTGSRCSLYYDRDVTLGFTPLTSMVRFEIELYTNAPSRDTHVFLDNIQIALGVEPKLALYYNDRGQRVRKEAYVNGSPKTNTYYVRDVGGSTVAIYSRVVESAQRGEVPEEHPVYGSSRIGVFYRDQRDTDKGTYAYQITDHLGNVRAVLVKDGQNALSLTNQTDYYPGGMAMPNRNIVGDYRYDYQGQELDQETGKVAFELRLYDPRINRWLTTDPYGQYHSPYVGMGNDWINGIDPDGGWKTKWGRFWGWVGNGFKGEFYNSDVATGQGKYGLAFDYGGGSGEGELTGSFMAVSGADLDSWNGNQALNNWRFTEDGSGYDIAVIVQKQHNFFGSIENSLNNSDSALSSVGSMGYNMVDDVYSFGTHFSLLSPNGPRHLNGNGIVRGSSEGIDTGINGMLTIATFGRLKKPTMNMGQFNAEYKGVLTRTIKSSKIKGIILKNMNRLNKYWGRQVIAPNLKTVKGVSESIFGAE
ncbi:RHS repeat domain-containing protein [Subsaximicrobium wynnwilliamsii]|nr:RHS repeat-associated core domain-containing protein [Subsaximicrobium wynnwilliamsii]